MSNSLVQGLLRETDRDGLHYRGPQPQQQRQPQPMNMGPPMSSDGVVYMPAQTPGWLIALLVLLGVAAVLGIILGGIALANTSKTENLEVTGTLNLDNATVLPARQEALVITVPAPGARRRNSRHDLRQASYRKSATPLSPGSKRKHVESMISASRKRSSGHSKGMESYIKPNMFEKFSPAQKRKTTAQFHKMLDIAESRRRRDAKLRKRQVLTGVHPQYQDAQVVELTASSIQAALNECGDRGNVVLCRIILEEGTYTESIHVSGFHNGAGLGAGPSAGPFSIEILGDMRNSAQRTYVHRGVNHINSVRAVNSTEFGAPFGSTGTCVDISFPSASSVSMELQNYNGVPLPPMVGSTPLSQPRFVTSSSEIEVGQPIRIYLPLTFDECAVATAPVYHEATITGFTNNTISFSPPLAGGAPSTTAEATTVVIMPVVRIKGVPSTVNAELAPATVTVASGADVLIIGVHILAADVPSNINAGRQESVVDVLGGLLSIPQCVVDDADSTVLFSVLRAKNTGILTNYLFQTYFDFPNADEDTTSEALGTVGLPVISTARASQSTTVFGGFNGLGQTTIDGTGTLVASDWTAVSGRDPINALDAATVLISRLNIADTPDSCMFINGASDVGVTIFHCLGAGVTGVWADGNTRVRISARSRISIRGTGETYGCYSMFDNTNVAVGTDPFSGFTVSAALNFLLPVGQGHECRFTPTPNCDPTNAITGLWALHHASMQHSWGIDFQGWNVTVFGDYLVGEQTSVLVGERADDETFAELFSGSMRRLRTPCGYSDAVGTVQSECLSANFVSGSDPAALVNEAASKYVGNGLYTLCDTAGEEHTITLDTPRFNCQPTLQVASFNGVKGSCLTWIVNEDGSCWNVVTSNGVTFGPIPP